MARYNKLYLLGSGSYGKVWIVESNGLIKETKVLKEIRLHGLVDRDAEQALTEVAILARCRHNNIISYTEAFVNESGLSIVMEYASGGDVHKQITQRRGLYFPNELVATWFSQIMSALSYIHKRGILHRDIKPQNLFLTERQIIKLGDFGISKILKYDSDVALTLIGTPFYLSPEICKQRPYSFKSDMWSAGCVLYEMCCLHVPFTAADLPNLALQIQQGIYRPLPSHCDDVFSHLVRSLLTCDPDKRPTADDVLDIFEPQVISQKPAPVKEEDVAYPSRGRSPVKKKKKDVIISSKKVTNEESDCRIKQLVHLKDRQNLARKIDSTTYTVVKHPKLRRLSLASPELCAMLEKQRTQSLENHRAMSVDAPYTQKIKKQSTPPRLSLLKSLQLMRKNDNDDDATEEKEENCGKLPERQQRDSVVENITEIVYDCWVCGSPPQEASKSILSQLQGVLGDKTAEAFIKAVKTKKMHYRELQVKFDIEPAIVLSVLCYLKLID